MRRKDLHASFSAVRHAGAVPDTVLELLAEYEPIIAPGEFFSHATAALLHGMWLPLRVQRDLRLHVSVHKPQRAPRDKRVRGHHLIPRPAIVESVAGLPVAGPVETWCQLATMLSVDELVIAGDSLLAHGRPYPDETLAELQVAATDRHRPAAAMLGRAVWLLRAGHRSPKESELRLLLLHAGLPEFEINADVFDEDGAWVAEVDLLREIERVILEYEGDGHRVDKRRFRKDIGRYETLQDLRWRVVRVTEDDLARADRRAELVRRVRRLLRP